MRPTTTWRVRAWIRVAAVVGWLVLLAEQFSILHFVARGEMPATEVRNGWVALLFGALGVALLAFRPSIAVDATRVRLRGPLRTAEFARDDVTSVAPTAWGLCFSLRDGSRHTSIVCQDTMSWSEPRWFDVAEAVTGTRPVCEDLEDPSEEVDE